MTVILNTWIFENDVKNGVKQDELIDRVSKLDVDGIEVRREYFKDLAVELPIIAKKAMQYKLLINYSVPDQVFLDDGVLNPKLAMYFEEGLIMGIKKIKFNIGNFAAFTGDLKQAFSALPLDKITMNVENDQTELSGRVKALVTFLESAKQHDIPVGYVYDLGNWAFTKQDALKSAESLSQYTDYVHLKNVINNDGNLVTSANLDEGMFNWRVILKHLPKNVAFALEFPMDNKDLIQSQITLLKKEIEE
ncbi:sugar phosphate isomerase/epimerase family protein [Dellaglioa carnosa]|uniref:Sugar phosphate isomerase/epimerase n=1 Tax=Dellaglioa carnosa TaxID=2995136 RepID=A0ABT4JJK4_9LACO|nr:sugar phosphate isomerase/epimerase [Dellaglioa carnosa]MCZ2490532.1 sugar phosphate isomerase/epimerase [Dellaglioa carnosa]MCZ2493610.1 sugar phosphate isomerase/epimerase [Dellaglioa carnosa]MDK1730474.1 sugar phosphate isomerase/epimerase [Dellaglioa carnosa]